MRRRLAIMLALGVWAVPAFAQVSATTGAINGKVTDDTGGVLPGVTVTIASPAMQGVQTSVTNAEGNYRFAAVPPGDYSITFELPGFNTVVREGIRVGLGFTATVNIGMGVATLEETITVRGESPVVDVTSTKTITNFDASKLAALPGARDFWAILAAAPAMQMGRIDVGGSRAGTQTPYSAYDTKSSQHRPMVEGMVMTEGRGAALFYYDFGSMDEVAVGTGSHSADMGTPGVVSQFIAKSGGNQYHGTVRYDYQNENIQSRNIDADQIARGATGSGSLDATELNRMNSYYDVNADLGGFLVRDKLWFYASGRDQDIKARLPNFPVIPHETRLINYTGKGTYSLNTNNKFIGFSSGGRKNQPNRLDRYRLGSSSAIHTSTDSTWNQLYWGFVHKGEWNSVLSDNAFFEVRAGKIGYDWPNFRYSEAPAVEDLGNNLVFGGNRDWQQDRQRAQVLSSMSYYKDGWGGNHSFKFGGEVFREIRRDHRGPAGNGMWPGGDVLHLLRNGAPIEVYLFETPSVNDSRLFTYSGYASDTWAMNSHLTLNLGLRYDRYRSYLPAQEHNPGAFQRFTDQTISFAAVDDLLTWNLWAPRFGLTYDLTGNGKTVLKANYGLYWWNPSTDLANSANPNSGEWFRRYAWTDPNRNGVYDPGEEGALLLQRGGDTATELDPNIKDTRTNEVAGWIEHELIPDFGLRTGIVYRRINNYYQSYDANQPFSAFNVPVSVQDPGPDGVVGTSDDGGVIQAFNLDPALVGQPSLNVTGNVPAEAEFYTWEVSGTKRMSNGWSLITGFSYQWIRDHDSGYVGNNLRSGAEGAPVNPNELINTTDGRYDFTKYTFKVNGTWQAPWWGIIVSPSYRFQSGQPFGRVFVARLNYSSSVPILAEPIDTNRQDNISLFDFRVEKVVPVGTSRITGFFDLYNTFNSNSDEFITWRSGTSYLRPTAIVSPRIARFGVKLDF